MEGRESDRTPDKPEIAGEEMEVAWPRGRGAGEKRNERKGGIDGAAKRQRSEVGMGANEGM